MRKLLALFLSAGFCLASGIWTPEAWAKDSKDSKNASIKLVATVDMAAPEQQPILDVQMTNESGHMIRIPDPPLLCKPAPGALSLQVKFVPQDANQSQPPDTCDLEVDSSGLADIRERAKNWLTIKPGQTYEARRPIAMGINANDRGTYELWVIYDGPCADDTDSQKLQSAGIDTVIGRFESEKLTYKVTAPRE